MSALATAPLFFLTKLAKSIVFQARAYVVLNEQGAAAETAFSGELETASVVSLVAFVAVTAAFPRCVAFLRFWIGVLTASVAASWWLAADQSGARLAAHACLLLAATMIENSLLVRTATSVLGKRLASIVGSISNIAFILNASRLNLDLASALLTAGAAAVFTFAPLAAAPAPEEKLTGSQSATGSTEARRKAHGSDDETSESDRDAPQRSAVEATEGVPIVPLSVFAVAVAASAVHLNGEQILDALTNLKITADMAGGRVAGAVWKQLIVIVASLVASIGTFELIQNPSERHGLVVANWFAFQMFRAACFYVGFSATPLTVVLIAADKLTGSLAEDTFALRYRDALVARSTLRKDDLGPVAKLRSVSFLLALQAFLEDLTGGLVKKLVRAFAAQPMVLLVVSPMLNMSVWLLLDRMSKR